MFFEIHPYADLGRDFMWPRSDTYFKHGFPPGKIPSNTAPRIRKTQTAPRVQTRRTPDSRSGMKGRTIMDREGRR